MTNYDAAIEQADRLRTTINTAGWKDIVAIKNDKKTYHTQIALTEKDFNEILRAQAYIMAIDDLFLEIEALLNVGDEAQLRKKK